MGPTKRVCAGAPLASTTSDDTAVVLWPVPRSARQADKPEGRDQHPFLAKDTAGDPHGQQSRFTEQFKQHHRIVRPER